MFIGPPLPPFNFQPVRSYRYWGGGGASITPQEPNDLESSNDDWLFIVFFVPMLVIIAIGVLFFALAFLTSKNHVNHEPPKPVVHIEGKVVKNIHSDFHDVVVEFEDGHKLKVHASKRLSVTTE